MHDLPLELMTFQNAEIIGNQLGKFLCAESDGSSVSQRKSLLRIKVLLPLNNPLIIGFNQARTNRPPSWVQLKYERLSDFCFTCSRMVHSKIYCPGTGIIPSPSLFGPGLRAVPPAPYKIENILSPIKVVSSAPIYSHISPIFSYAPCSSMQASPSSSNLHSIPMDTTEST